MTEDIKVNDGQMGEEGQVKSEAPSRSENRIKDLADKLKEQEARHALEKEEIEKARAKAEKEAKEARFEMELASQTSKYPHAKEFVNDIKSYAEKGLPVEEATLLVLTKNQKLVTSEAMAKAKVDSSSFGGSSVSLPSTGEQDPTRMTQEQRRAELEKMSPSEWKDALKGFNQ